jgi:hypothetical protein
MGVVEGVHKQISIIEPFTGRMSLYDNPQNPNSMHAFDAWQTTQRLMAMQFLIEWAFLERQIGRVAALVTEDARISSLFWAKRSVISGT